MISFINISTQEPYSKFLSLYDSAHQSDQRNIEAACISSISFENKPNARFVNIKYLDQKYFIFFSNYNSQKADDFTNNNFVSLSFFWNSTQTQIRISGVIKKTEKKYSDDHWKTRNIKKNALAYSSKQSKMINSFEKVKEKYSDTLVNSDLSKRPEYWGGYKILPNRFEFWQGQENRLNKRELYILKGNNFHKYFLEP